MPRITLVQTNFTAGELSPRLYGRVDVARYQNGAKLIENAFPTIHGGVKRRPGTRFVAATKHSDKFARLIPFVFSRDQAYVLEFGDLYMRVFKDGLQVESSPGVPFELVTPYTEAMLDDLDYVQGADTMFIAHPSVPIYRLRREDHDDWSLSAAPFVVTPFDEIGIAPATTLTLSALTVGAGRTFTAGAASFLASDVGREIWSAAGLAEITGFTSTTVVTAEIKVAFSASPIASGDWQIKNSPQTTCTASAVGPVGAAITLTLGAAGWRASDVGSFVKINGGLCLITGFTSDTIVNAEVKQVLSSTTAAPANSWSLESPVWNAIDGYPRTVTLYEQRLVAAGSPGYPQTVWMSHIGESLNFELGTRDDDAMSFTISSDQINPIVHMAQVKTLIALTYGGEFALYGGVERPITPTNIQVKNQSVYGCNNIRPVRIGNELFFVQRANRKIRALAYKAESDTYGSPDLSVLAEHITESGILDMAYQQEPESILWTVRADGLLATMTIDRDQDVVGWARQTTDGYFESTASIPTADSEQVWVIVNRTIGGVEKRYIEYFDDSLNTDSTITGTSGPGAATWSGLGHLEGETVDVVADGVVMAQATVTGGEITIARDAFEIEIGLHYKTRIELLTPEAQTGTGSAQGNSMRTHEASVRYLQSYGGTVNGQEIQSRRFDQPVLDQPAPLLDGVKRVEKLGWERGEDAIVLEQDQPLPFHILSVVRKFNVND